jgi:hypothetical protein
MPTCTYCHTRKGKRPCPALGSICSSCCGEHRGREIACPPGCTWLVSARPRPEPAAPLPEREVAWERHAVDASRPLDYDAEVDPTPGQWLALDEDDRAGIVQAFHDATCPDEVGASPWLHAAIHVMVETNLAEGRPAAVAALRRLRAEGLGRHDAIHALGSVMVEEIYDVLKQGRPHDEAGTDARLARLTVSSWRALR